jgi:hypothetical protein
VLLVQLLVPGVLVRRALMVASPFFHSRDMVSQGEVMEKTFKLDKPVDSFALGKKGLAQVITSPMSIRKVVKKTTVRNEDGSETTSSKTVTEATWLIRAEGSSPRDGIRVELVLPDDIAAALEKFHDAATTKAVAAADD